MITVRDLIAKLNEFLQDARCYAYKPAIAPVDAVFEDWGEWKTAEVWDVAREPDGSIWVCSRADGTIRHFGPDGSLLEERRL